MPEIVKTSRDEKHFHAVYLGDMDTGYTSVDSGHGHTVSRPLLAQGIQDEQGQEVQPPQFGEWAVDPINDHSHYLEEIGQEEIKDEDADKLRADFYRMYVEVRSHEETSCDKAEEAEGFYSGDGQWDKKVKDKLAQEERCALTLNEIEPKIDLLSGYQRRNRMDIRFLPVEGNDARGAEISNMLLKQVLAENVFVNEESEVFDDEAIAGRGNFNIYVDYDKNIEGDIIVERYPWQDIKYGPHERKDLRDCECLFKDQWWSVAKTAQTWPDEAEDIEQQMSMADDIPAKDVTVVPGKQYDTPQGNDVFTDVQGIKSGDLINTTKKTVHLLERWMKTYKKIHVLQNANDNFYISTEDWEKDVIEKAKKLAGIKAIPRVVTRMRITTFAGKVKVEDDRPDLAIQDFYMVPVYCKKRRGKDGTSNFWGKVKTAMDPQRNINKRESQMTDILNKCVAYGYYYDDDTFASKKDAKAFRKNSSKPGFTQRVNDSSKIPVKVEGVKFPGEVANMIGMDREALYNIMNVPPAMMGQQGGVESGVAILEKKRQGLMGNEFLFDNLALAKRKLAKIIIAIIQQIYTAERVLRIIRSQSTQGLKDPMNPTQTMIGDRNAESFTLEEVQEILDNNDLTKYDIQVSESPWSPTMRRATLSEWSTLAQHGFEVPPQFLLDLTDLPQQQREEVKAMIQQQQEQAQELEMAKINAEIGKSMIAAESKQGGQSAE